ncbi:hypothetical protein ACLQ3B_01835 [Micromonospora sp. DT53]|uniref:hypothetical protein n=1 Tax=Micromonospora sp. DT53 TaxID=3393444 RepID=UPI003CF60766
MRGSASPWWFAAELTMREAVLREPRPVQDRIPLTIGAANSTLLRWAGANADVVGLTGFGRTLADGHQHEARWRSDQIEAQLACVAAGAAGRTDPPALEALVQTVVVTDDAEAAAAEQARRNGMTPAELLATPFVLIGTVDEISTAVAEHERRWGVTRFVVRADALNPLVPVLARLT